MQRKTLFDTFNARYLTFEEIGESFISNKQFIELIENNHSLLMGPRGSGKTTMLKMLTPLALESWLGGEKAKEIRENIPFYSIYIPTDIQWKREIEQIEKQLSKFEGFGEAISKEIVNVNILISLCRTFSDLMTTKLSKDELLDVEVKLAKELVDVWKIDKPIAPNILSIQQFFLTRIKSINQLVNRVKSTANFDPKTDYPEYFFATFYDLVNEGLSCFEKLFKTHPGFNKKPFRWALCFDELEIAPKWLQDLLLVYLRSRDQKIIFKLTTSPIVSLSSEVKNIEAQKDNDYKIIRIWVSNNKEMKEWNKFCDKLIGKRIQRKLNEVSITPNFLFGNVEEDRVLKSDFPHANAAAKDGERGSFSWYLYKQLAEDDSTFKQYLTSKNIDPKDPIIENIKIADSVTRKIKQIAIFRHAINKERRLGRSRKVVSLYYGIPHLYEISDGNPRTIIGLIDKLLFELEGDNKNNPRSLPINLQSRIANEVSSNFLELISAHPDANKILYNKNLNLGELIKTIGVYFFNRMIKDDFRADPSNTFIVDEDVPNKIQELLLLGLELGAIVYLEPSEGISENGLVNKKFRLSYMLTPCFNLPTREYNCLNLSTILARDKNTSTQKKLF